MDKVKIGCPIDYTDNENIERTGLFLREPEVKELEKRLKKINKLTDLEHQVKKQKEVIDKIESLIKSKDNGTCIHNNERRGAYTFVLDFDEAREFVWNLEDILKEEK